ncbi:ANTAR domain-containing protein [Streptomyces sp. NPDC127108]|uniref:ANTAR domain-containing protein n=1 Tax=Streptomyces sp. NPDC127108 TaxID=3345361 RepID=UPI003631482A
MTTHIGTLIEAREPAPAGQMGKTMTVSPDMGRLLARLARRRDFPAADLTDELRRCARMLRLDGLALSLAQAGGAPELLWHTDEKAALLDDLQFTQGQGPSSDVLHSHTPVLWPDLTCFPPNQWPGLAAALQELGVQAVFAFPLSVGVIHLGALTGHRAAPGPLYPQQTDDALALTDTLTELLTSPGAPTVLAGHSCLHRAEVHQATGMTAVRLNVSAADALARIRAHAYRHNEPLLDTARAILTRRLSLTDNSRPADGT